MIDLLRLCRLYYSIPMALTYMLTVCYALDSAAAWRSRGTLLSTLAMAFVVAAGYVLNDVCDRDVDRINAPQRPLAAGRITPAAGIAWGLALLAAGLTSAATCGRSFLAALSLVAAGLVLYDRFSKRLSIGKQLLVAALMTSIYPLAFVQAGGLAGRRAPALIVFAVWMLLTSFGYEVLKDLRDAAGDHAAASHATWLQRRRHRGRTVSRVTIAAGSVALIGPYLDGCGPVYMTIASLAILAATVSALLPVRKALMAVYVECVVVGIAATADLIVEAA